MKNIITGLKTFFLVAIICGLLYPCVVTLAGQVVFHEKANGSLIYDATDKETVIGSQLLGQTFTSDKYFHGRPREISNLPSNSKVLQQKWAERSAAYDGEVAAIPSDLITGSASGYDRYISLAAAKFQVSRIAKARNITQQELEKLITNYQEENFLSGDDSVLVPVLPLNLALDALNR